MTLLSVAEVRHCFVHPVQTIFIIQHSFARTAAPCFCAYPPKRMKLSGICFGLGVVPLVNLTCAQVTGGGGGGPSNVRAGTRRLDQAIPKAGVVGVHSIGRGDEQVAEDLIGILEAKRPGVTGETLCPPSSMSYM